MDRILNDNLFNSKTQKVVFVRNGCKSYDIKLKNVVVVLDKLNMTVPKGTIYGLLGSSGCGKTTLLSCIVGRKQLNSGVLKVFGAIPGSKESGIPGPRLGYMPQELGMTQELSIEEAIKYYGWIAGMNNNQIAEKSKFLINLLMLPNGKRLIKNLSGGQQRRVSFAVTLVHEPELLILDEPTVGLDSLLRQTIWDYLIHITKEKGSTVIITTHYIDETQQADLVSLLRGGYLLAEEPPDKLMQRLGVNTLEDVFYKLSLEQNLKQHPQETKAEELNNESSIGNFTDDVDFNSQELTNDVLSLNFIKRKVTLQKKSPTHSTSLSGNRMKALVWKNILWMSRNKASIAFVIVLPFIQISLFCLAIGRNPTEIPVAIVNRESNNTKNCSSLLQCNGTQLGCNYLGYLEKQALKLILFNNEDDARTSVIKGKTYASIMINQNYSIALKKRVKSWTFASAKTINNSEIEVIYDVSYVSISLYIKFYIFSTFQKFIQDYLETCRINKKVLTYPVRILKPVYGERYPNFTDFVAPGALLTITLFLSMALTAGTMLIERNDGNLERSLVAGIKGTEILFAYLVCESLCVIGQVLLLIICIFGIFNMTQNGSYGIVFSITLLVGISGMLFGFLISCFCESERDATFLAMGIFLPVIVLSDIIWPLEAMSKYLQMISYFLPLTKVTEALRSVLQKGWGLSNRVVYTGFISIGIWIAVALIFSILVMKYKQL